MHYIFFVTGLEQLGCRSFSELTAQFVSNASILIKNKEFYPELRDFMRYLNVSGYTDLDFSTLIPKYRRRFRIPTTYTAEEISKVEQSVDTSVPPGKFLGHASVQTTQIYAKSSQANVDKHVREWNERNFPNTLYSNAPDKEQTNVPDFQKSR